jgi:Fe-S-cluster-containing hydrogenase component 2
MKKENGSLQNKTNGFVALEELKKAPGYPSEERFQKGPVPVIECIEEIPCDPCQTACNRNLIIVGKPITNLPRLIDPEGACGGCAKCIVICPGLAVFVVDKTFSANEASIALPYELLPLPEEGEEIQGVDRTGKVVCEGYVQKIISGKKLNHTNVVTIVVPKEFADEVRHFYRRVQ